MEESNTEMTMEPDSPSAEEVSNSPTFPTVSPYSDAKASKLYNPTLWTNKCEDLCHSDREQRLEAVMYFRRILAIGKLIFMLNYVVN